MAGRSVSASEIQASGGAKADTIQREQNHFTATKRKMARMRFASGLYRRVIAK
jgi:hypothetical protein